MGKKLEETLKLIEKTRHNINNDNRPTNIIREDAKMEILYDMAKSLAIIADNMENVKDKVW